MMVITCVVCGKPVDPYKKGWFDWRKAMWYSTDEQAEGHVMCLGCFEKAVNDLTQRIRNAPDLLTAEAEFVTGMGVFGRGDDALRFTEKVDHAENDDPFFDYGDDDTFGKLPPKGLFED